MKLPEGWTIENTSSDEQKVITSPAPERYMVTVDFYCRGFRSGYATYGRLLNRHGYRGRGWKQTLCDDAVEWLIKNVIN